MGPLSGAFATFLVTFSLLPGDSIASANGAAQTTCTYDEPSKTVTVTVPAQDVEDYIWLSVEAGAIQFQELDDRTFELTPKQPCGAATTSNSDLVRIQSGAPVTVSVVDQSTGAFAPGFTSEPMGTSEIEFEFEPVGLIGFLGSPTPAVVRLGSLGANVNGDDDVDVTFLSADAAFGYAGSPGDDDIAGTGGLGTGDPTTRFLSGFGFAGNDYLTAGPGRVELYGDTGNDIVIGGPGGDNLDGGPGLDRITAGAGRDFLEGAGGNDVLLGGAGQDFLNGGAGRDRCMGGSGRDRELRCER
jgi:Ca2+-binding RTX toxin-like protein